MNRAAPVLAILLGLAGCDGKQLDNIPRSMSAPDLERAAGNIACNTQQNLEQKSDIAIRGTENVVVATGLLSERVGREPVACGIEQKQQHKAAFGQAMRRQQGGAVPVDGRRQ